jgi:AcrR family transcriptional regulator
VTTAPRSAGPRSAGRPRDATIDDRVLTATRDLLATEGFDATTIQAITERSGVHASAVYRRWPSRIEIIEEAVFPGFAAVTVEATGDLRRDLRRFIRVYLSTLGEPAARAAMPGLLACYQSNARDEGPEKWLAVSARPQFWDILRAAPSVLVDPAVDPDDVFDVLLGAIIARVLVPTVVRRDRPVERLVDMTLRLLHPTAVDAPA